MDGRITADEQANYRPVIRLARRWQNEGVLSIRMRHDGALGRWTAITDEAFTYSFRGEPEFGPWWAALRQELRHRGLDEIADVRESVVRKEFDAAVSWVRGDCGCPQCHPGVSQLEALKAAAEKRSQERRSAGRRFPIPAPEYVAAALEHIAEPPAPKSSCVTAAERYTTARERYMRTGTSADKEVMLGFVTETEPDLDTLGRDWEPVPEPQAPRFSASTRVRIGVALIAASTLMVIASVLLIGSVVSVILASCAALISFSYLAFGRWRAPRSPARTSPPVRALR